MTRKPKSDYSIQTVTNALRLLESFRDRDELGVTELSRRLALHTNNVFRLLATLEEAGYIEQSSDTDRYRLGVRCLEIGQAFSRGDALMRRARPVLADLCGRLRESSHLAVLRDFEVVHLCGEHCDRLVSTSSRVGLRLPAHCTALGKVLLGCAGEAVREEYDRELVELHCLQSRTASTIVDREKLFEHLRAVGSQGFAVDVEECEPGLTCAAAPVYDATGRLVAALSVSAPSFRIDEQTLLDGTVPAVVAGAEELSRGLGYGA
jgi:IclR family transcriptional regulator, KDG regulon repressor